MCGGSTRVPTPPPPPPAPPEPPTPIDPAVSKARSDETTRLKAARGRKASIVTGALGLENDANTGSQKLSGT